LKWNCMMSDKNEILKKRFYKLQKHYEAFKSYHQLIEEMLLKEDILTVEKFKGKFSNAIV